MYKENVYESLNKALAVNLHLEVEDLSAVSRDLSVMLSSFSSVLLSHCSNAAWYCRPGSVPASFSVYRSQVCAVVDTPGVVHCICSVVTYFQYFPNDVFQLSVLADL